MIIELITFTGDTGADYKAAMDIRNEVFVKGQNVDKFLEYDSYDLTSVHYLLKADGVSVATSRWRETDEGIKLERLAVLDEFRGFGYGYLVLKHMVQEVKPSKQKIYLYAQTSVTKLYKTAGFTEEGEKFFEAGIEHISMKLK